MNEVRNTEDILQKILPYRDVLKLLSEKSGLNITTSNLAYEIYNQLAARV